MYLVSKCFVEKHCCCYICYVGAIHYLDNCMCKVLLLRSNWKRYLLVATKLMLLRSKCTLLINMRTKYKIL